MKFLCVGIAILSLSLIPVALAGCSAATPAQTAAAQKLAADCKRNPKDPAMEFIKAEGSTVYLSLTDDQRKKMEATMAQDVSAGNLSDLTKNPNYMEGFGIGMGVYADIKCLASKSGVPTDKDGQPKAGDWPDWRVSLDSHADPILTSTLKG